MNNNKSISRPVCKYFILFCLFSLTTATANPLVYSSNQKHYKPSPINQEEIIEVTPLHKNQECIVSNDGTYPANISIPCSINLDTNKYEPLYFELVADLFTSEVGGLISVFDNDIPIDIYPNVYIPIENAWSKWKARGNTVQIKDQYNLTITIVPNYSNLVKAKNISLRLHVIPKN